MSQLTKLLNIARESSDNLAYWSAARYDLAEILEANAEAIQRLWEATEVQPKEADPHGVNYSYQNYWYCPICEGEGEAGNSAETIIHTDDCPVEALRPLCGDAE